MKLLCVLPWTVMTMIACAAGVEVDEPTATPDAGTVRDAATPTRDASTTPDASARPDATPDARFDAAPDVDAAPPVFEPDPPFIEDGPSACVRTLTIDPTLGTTTSGTFLQCDQPLDRPVLPSADYDTCRTGGAFPLATYHLYVELRNPASHPVKVELRVDSPAGGEWVSTYVAAYGDVPTTTAERDACITGVNARCTDPAGLADSRWPCLLGDAAPTIGANDSIVVYVPQHNPPGQPGGATPARFVLRATDVSHVP